MLSYLLIETLVRHPENSYYVISEVGGVCACVPGQHLVCKSSCDCKWPFQKSTSSILLAMQ